MGNNERSERDNRFKSIGTIQVRMRREKHGSDLRNSIGFTPINDYSAEHKGKKYALFFRKTKGGADCISRVLPDSGGGVKIAGANGFPDLVAVAIEQLSVEVEVCAKGIDARAGLHLVGVAIPASRKM